MYFDGKMISHKSAIIFNKGMWGHSTRIELFYYDDNFRCIAQWILAFTVRTLEDISTIQILQNKSLISCLRIINNIDVPTYELHLRLNIQPFDKRMQYFLLCSIYRIFPRLYGIDANIW